MSDKYAALKQAAEKAGGDVWQAKQISGDAYVIRKGSYSTHKGIRSYQPIAEIDHKPVRDFVAAANPATILELLAERDADKRRIAELTAERDALREGEMGDAKHSNTRAAADIYFQLVEECEIPPGGSLVEHIDDMRERLAELETVERASTSRREALERTHKMYQRERDRADSAEKLVTELEARTLTVKLPDGWHFEECETERCNGGAVYSVGAGMKNIHLCDECSREARYSRMKKTALPKRLPFKMPAGISLKIEGE